MAGDLLFQAIEKIQGKTPWGRVLDAGTGDHSLRWLRSLNTTGWTAVTIDQSRMSKLLPRLQHELRPTDQLVLGDWMDETLLQGEQFDVVLVDYLIGAIDAFTPYYQTQILQRLHPHVRGQLYLIGWEPFDENSTHPAHRAIVDLSKTKDSCRLLTSQRPYREYPASWVKQQLELAGFQVLSVEHFPNIFHASYVRTQTQACYGLIDKFDDEPLALAMRQRVDRLRKKLMPYAETKKGIRFGSDYVITATPQHKHP